MGGGRLLEERLFKTEDLYVLAWSHSMLSLADSFGVTSNGLKKRFETIGIPIPQGPFWAKRSEGYFKGFPEFPAHLRGKHVSMVVPTDLDLKPLWDSDYHDEALDALKNHVPAQKVTRGELYALVWSYPPNELGKLIETSPTDIKNVCKAAGIPMPSPQDWSVRAQSGPMRRKKLVRNPADQVLEVRGQINVGSILTHLPKDEEVTLAERKVGLAAQRLIDPWLEMRRDKARASKAGAQNGLFYFGLADATRAVIIDFLKDYPLPPATTKRRELELMGVSKGDRSEILSSLASLTRFYRDDDEVLRKREAARGSRVDSLDADRRIAMARSLLSWFENSPQAARDWRHSRDHAMYGLIFYCGIKIEHLLAIRRKDLDLFGGTLTYRGKNNESLTVRLPEQTILPLWRYGSSRVLASNGPLFVNHHGQILRRSGLNDVFNERLKQSGTSSELQLRSIRMAHSEFKAGHDANVAPVVSGVPGGPKRRSRANRAANAL